MWPQGQDQIKGMVVRHFDKTSEGLLMLFCLDYIIYIKKVSKILKSLPIIDRSSATSKSF